MDFFEEMEARIPKGKVRTRFAPSPTGLSLIHIYVYAHTREECEEKLKVLIAEMKAELAELKRQKGDRH